MVRLLCLRVTHHESANVSAIQAHKILLTYQRALWTCGLWACGNWTVGSMGFSNEKSLFVVWSFRILSNVFLMFLILWPLKHLLAPDDVEFASEN